MQVSDLEDSIVLHVPDASAVILQAVLQAAASRFMRESKVFEDTLCVETQCGVPEYPLVLAPGRQLVTVTGVQVGDSLTGWQDMEDPYSGVNWNMDTFYPVLVLRDVPQRDGGKYMVRYAWAVSTSDCDVPNDLGGRWLGAVKHAALAEMFAMPKQEWANASLALYHEDCYRVELGKAVNARWQNFSRRPLSIASRPFLAPRR